MNLELTKKEILPPLKIVGGVIETKQVMSIMSHYLLRTEGDVLTIIGGDNEVEMQHTIPVETGNDFSVTLPRKVLDVIRSLPDGSDVSIKSKGDDSGQVVVASGKSRFTLATLSAEDYPNSPDIQASAPSKKKGKDKGQVTQFTLPQADLKTYLSRVAFCIASNDVRYYLMGVKLELHDDQLSLAATDGHRLAVASAELETDSTGDIDVIVPRKAVLELLKLLGDEGEVTVLCSLTHCKFIIRDNLTLVSKLIEGTYPDWRSVIPQNAGMLVIADTAQLKQAIQRVMLLSNEKYKGVRLTLGENLLTLNARNPNQEEASEELEVVYTGDALEIGFNGQYLLEVLSTIPTAKTRLAFTDPNSSVLITPPDDHQLMQWIVMPMRL